MAHIIYVGHPAENTIPGLAACISGFFGSAAFKTANPEWSCRMVCYEANSALKPTNFCSLVGTNIGPVLLIRPIRNDDYEEIQRRLGGRTPVSLHDAYDSDSFELAWIDVKQAHDNGEPLFPANVITALLLMNKLDAERRWSGHNDKGYMWADDLPNGRGFDEKFTQHLGQVINLLFQSGLIINKISKGKKKWALNPEKRRQIYNILRKRSFQEFDTDLTGKLSRGPGRYSVRELDCLGDFLDREQMD